MNTDNGKQKRNRILIGAAIAVAAIVFVINLIKILSVPYTDIKLDAGNLSYDEYEQGYLTPLGCSVPKGIYDITIRYRTDEKINAMVRGNTGAHNGIYLKTFPEIYLRNLLYSFLIYLLLFR